MQKEAIFELRKDDEGLYLHNDDVDLQETAVTVPIEIDNQFGVLEVTARKIGYHPPMGEEVDMTISEFLTAASVLSSTSVGRFFKFTKYGVYIAE